jgi:hypothetical protein
VQTPSLDISIKTERQKIRNLLVEFTRKLMQIHENQQFWASNPSNLKKSEEIDEKRQNPMKINEFTRKVDANT